MCLQSKLIKQLEENVQHLEQEKQSLEEKVYNLEILLHVKMWNYFFLSFRRVVNVIYSFLGNSPASEI